MATGPQLSLFTRREKRDSKKRAEIFLLSSILFHVVLLIIFSLLTINAASKSDKPLVVTFKEEEPKDRYEFNDFPQANETKEDVKSNRLSDKNRKVDKETTRMGTPLGGGSSPPGVMSPSPVMPAKPTERTESRDTVDEGTLLAKKETPSEIKKKVEKSSPSENKGRLTVEDLIPNGDDVSRLDQPYGTWAPDVTEEESVSLNTTEFKYYAYFAHIKRQIELAWNYPSEAQRNRWGGNLVVLFTVERDGRVSSVKLLRSSGHEILDEYAIKAIWIASPFNPIPASIGTKRLRINANFQYIMSLFGNR
jgi:protein TonB